MQPKIRVLLVHGEESPLGELVPLLEGQGIEALRARNFAEAETALAHRGPVALIFTAPTLSDGTWIDIRRLADSREARVIVVARFVDVPLYIATLEGGAADFIVPPFTSADLAYVIEGALLGTSEAPPLLGRQRLRKAGPRSTAKTELLLKQSA